MANNKTNIYPVQLQGAELNLNKFDAEIKQYSGFNKNNSPFVGGCLANVFNKDVTIEGSSSKNTYIAPNGDIYKVDTTGLYKNGSKVLDVDATKLYDIEEAEGLESYDIVALFDEKCFVYCKVDNTDRLNPFNFIMRFYDPNVGEFREEFIVRTSEYSNYSFDCKRARCADNLYTWGCTYTSSYHWESRSYFGYNSFIGASYKDNDIVKYKFQLLKDYSDSDNGTGNTDNNSVCHMFYDESNDKLCFFNFTFGAGAGSHMFYEEDVTINTSGTDIVFSRDTTYSPAKPDSSGHFEKDFAYSFFLESGNKFHYVFSQNKIWFKLNVGIGGIQSPVSYVNNCYYKIVSDETVGWKIVFYDAYQAIFPIESKQNTYVTHNFGILYKYHIYTNSKARGICDFETIGVGFDENENLKFTTGCILSKMVLLNNEEVTGITLPDTQRILVTDWNSIAENKVFVPNIESGYEYCCDGQIQCFYKDKGGKYYKLKKVDYIFLSVINNQIVLNCDTFYNAYRITDGMQLLYAPSWNNRLYERYEVVRDTEITVNKYYYASAMNEYNLQDNASLLLNPAPIVNEPDPDSYKLGDNKAINYKLSYAVNVYSGATVPECKYFGSVINNDFSRMIKILPLEDLPFPIDTNGNVMYSPCIFSEIKSSFGNNLLIKNGSSYYPLAIGNDNTPVMSFYLASGIGIAGLENAFIIQGQYYGVINNQIYTLSFNNGVINSVIFIVNVQGLQFVGNTPYEALFYSKTNRCLYSFTGANVLIQRQLVDKISEVRNYLYNPATQTVFLITDIGVFFYGIFGQFLLEYTDIADVFLLDNGIVMGTDAGLYHYIKYYLDESDEGYQKNNIELETCFYGMNNEMVTINDCLYFRLFSEEHEEGNLKVSATTISLRGRKTEETTFRIKASDWDKITHSIYLRYQPKEQRGLGVSFSINSPFKIASLSVGSQPEAVLVDKVSKGAVTAPQITSHNVNW